MSGWIGNLSSPTAWQRGASVGFVDNSGRVEMRVVVVAKMSGLVTTLRLEPTLAPMDLRSEIAALTATFTRDVETLIRTTAIEAVTAALVGHTTPARGDVATLPAVPTKRRRGRPKGSGAKPAPKASPRPRARQQVAPPPATPVPTVGPVPPIKRAKRP